ncbi:MAG: hypothetical protein R3Y45_04910, partial [Bacillota bacterium]
PPQSLRDSSPEGGADNVLVWQPTKPRQCGNQCKNDEKRKKPRQCGKKCVGANPCVRPRGVGYRGTMAKRGNEWITTNAKKWIIQHNHMQ